MPEYKTVEYSMLSAQYIPNKNINDNNHLLHHITSSSIIFSNKNALPLFSEFIKRKNIMTPYNDV